MSTDRSILGLCVLIVATFSVVTVNVLPQSDAEIIDSVYDNIGEFDPEYTWDMPIYTSDSCIPDRTVRMTYVMDIDDMSYYMSMYSSIFRVKTVFEKSAAALIDPTDQYVQKVAAYLSEISEGYTDYQRINTTLYFVQSAIDYEYDSDLYGTYERWAYPVETLYAHAGDCEDSAVLFTSIMIAMGYDAVLLQYDGHVASGVLTSDIPFYARTYSDGENEYMFCECAADGQTISAGRGLASKRLTEVPEIVKPHAHPDICVLGYAYYVTRNLTYALTGI